MFATVLLSLAVAATSAVDLGVGVSVDRLLDPGIAYHLQAYYWNYEATPATGAVITIDLPAGVTPVTLPDVCTAAPGRVVCSVGDVAPGTYPVIGGSRTLDLVLLMPDRREGGPVTHKASIKGNEPDTYAGNDTFTYPSVVYTTFVVDTTSDSGSGSLRGAIDAANAVCGTGIECKVAFRFPAVPAAGFVTLAPESPLPALRAMNAAVDGTTQTRMFGDTNAAGPEVFLDGSKLREGSGLLLTNWCELDVRGLAVGNFPHNGILLQPDGTCLQQLWYDSRHIAANYIGVDPTGTKAAPNGRGVWVESAASKNPTTIDHNVISGNRHSGVFLATSSGTRVEWNVIGLDAPIGAPLGNGASGIYVGPHCVQTDITGNYIAFNGDFGVAVDRDAFATDIHPNSIFANGQLGIDVGLDGPTLNAGVHAPVITSAVYDAGSNTTVIDMAIISDPPGFPGPTLNVYASDAPHRLGYGDGQYYLGTAQLPSSTPPAYRFITTGDWRGKWVSATITHNNFFGFASVAPRGEGPDTYSTTSEFARAVEVK